MGSYESVKDDVAGIGFPRHERKPISPTTATYESRTTT